jgi:hypothetical protein
VILVVDKIGDLIQIDIQDLCGLGVVLEEGNCQPSESQCVDSASVLKTDTGLILILNMEDLLRGELETEIQQMIMATNNDDEVC